MSSEMMAMLMFGLGCALIGYIAGAVMQYYRLQRRFGFTDQESLDAWEAQRAVKRVRRRLAKLQGQDKS